ncbi:hypothetical protein EB796_021542 [Bugula neritina]|uniref:Nucleolar protein 4 helical domain-containing protein n=1 Tax=Bugula neritina TaxID=10212 RepID=A0A7J7J1Z6_BUGNE|nr:hypothetical protein EB796_021542 [Bugula neritina]
MSVTEVTMSSAEGQSSNVEGDPVAAAASLEETAATCIESACSSRESSPPHSTGEVKEEKLPAPTPTKSEPKIHSSSKVETLQDDSSTEALLEKSLPKIPLISSPLKRSADSSLNVSTCVYHCDCMLTSLAFPITLYHLLSPTMSKKSSDDADDDDEDEEDDKMLATTGLEFDPERLKAFNMFCRLFVDENLDRQVPISKQPKDKVQKILDACDRQFPEFRDRSRKRIRTYLKSCRRMRRTRELNGNNRDTSRPTPPHLTSPVAEQLLSVACENEAKNIRLINMGLEPSITTPKAKPVPNHITASSVPSSSSTLVSMPSLVPANIAQAATPSAAAAAAAAAAAHRMFPEWRFPHASHFRPDLAPFFGNGFFRPPFPGFPGHVPAAAALQASPAAAHLTLHSHPVNEITTPKKPSTPSLSISSSPSKGSVLTPAEVSSIRQLILGYRESATFLCKSADELEQLVSHAN